LSQVQSQDMCIVTEFLARGSLRDVLNLAGGNGNPTKLQLSCVQLIKMAIDAATGINYLHHHNPPIVHRDLKSQNLLVTEDFKVKVADLGLAKISSTALGNPQQPNDNSNTVRTAKTKHQDQTPMTLNQHSLTLNDILSNLSLPVPVVLWNTALGWYACP